MIDSEFARFVLKLYGVPYQEERHIFGWASLISLFRAGKLQIPLLSGDGPSLAGPEAMVAQFEPTMTPERRLIPAGCEAEIAADMRRYHGTLGDVTAVLGYYHLLPERALMLEPFSRGLSPREARMLPRVYPALHGLFNFLLHLNSQHAADTLDQTRLLFEEVDRRISDGRSYLVAGRLTLSDIALATAAAPVLLPTNYGSPMPPLEAMPPALRAIIGELRRHPTWHFVERIYREHR